MESDAIDEATVFRIAELREQDTRSDWTKTADELGFSEQQCKKLFYNAISRFKGSKTKCQMSSQLRELLTRLEPCIDFDYCLENFSDLCRFCFRLPSDTEAFREIYDTSEKNSVESSEFIEKIHFTLFDNVLENVDLRSQRFACESCFRKLEEFYSFKKESNRNAQTLLEAKNEIDRRQTSTGLDLVVETLRNEDEDCYNSEEEDLNSEDIEELEESEEEYLKSTESTDKTSNQNSPNVPKKRRDRKSYKGKNSQCPICGKLVKGIQMHMLIHSGERKHTCSYCPKTFTQSGQLKRHINSHLNIRNYKCPEIGCNRTFVDPSSVTKHLVVHNKEDRKFQCSLCGSRFNRLGALRYHEKTHRQERNHCCDICKKSFLAKYDLTKHYRTHTGEKPYSCKYCDKKFSISKNAKVHLRVHTKEKPYACRYCDLTFAYRSSMKSHLIKIHNQVDVSILPALKNISENDLDGPDDLIEEEHELETQNDQF